MAEILQRLTSDEKFFDKKEVSMYTYLFNEWN